MSENQIKRRGQPRKAPGVKKEKTSFRLDPWLIAKLRAAPGSQAELITDALCSYKGWTRPK